MTALMVLPTSADAQPNKKRQEWERVAAELSSSQARSQRLQKELAAMETELSRLSGEVTRVADALKESEQALTDAEDKLVILETEARKKQDDFAVRQQQLSGMVSAIIRLSRIPREAAILMPANFTERAGASRALGLTSQALKQEMDSLSVQLAELRRLQEKITAKRGDLKTKTGNLEEQRAALRKIITQRKQLMETLYSENAEEKQRIAELVKRSQNLQSLVTSLEKDKKARASAPSLKSPPVAKGASIARSKGNLRMPVAGTVTGKFGASRGPSMKLKGVEIIARSGAQVVAPYDGEVLFTGPFLDYGPMVILRHGEKYHTLLAGLGDLDCVQGQKIRAGEPVGIMGKDAPRKVLYLEFREDGRPVDPAAWIAGFESYLARR